MGEFAPERAHESSGRFWDAIRRLTDSDSAWNLWDRETPMGKILCAAALSQVHYHLNEFFDCR